VVVAVVVVDLPMEPAVLVADRVLVVVVVGVEMAVVLEAAEAVYLMELPAMVVVAVDHFLREFPGLVLQLVPVVLARVLEEVVVLQQLIL